MRGKKREELNTPVPDISKALKMANSIYVGANLME